MTSEIPSASLIFDRKEKGVIQNWLKWRFRDMHKLGEFFTPEMFLKMRRSRTGHDLKSLKYDPDGFKAAYKLVRICKISHLHRHMGRKIEVEERLKKSCISPQAYRLLVSDSTYGKLKSGDTLALANVGIKGNSLWSIPEDVMEIGSLVKEE